MRNFHMLTSGMDVMPLMVALNTQPNLWNQNRLRTEAKIEIENEEGDKELIETPHREIDDIWLRMNDLDKCIQAGADGSSIDHRESINYSAMKQLPQARALIFALMASVQGERLGRCMISRMSPGKCIYPHSDIGDDLSIYYDNEPYYSRFHIVLQGLPGSIFRCGDEEVCMQTGEVWWFDNVKEHEVINNSADDRIHLVVDIRTSK